MKIITNSLKLCVIFFSMVLCLNNVYASSLGAQKKNDDHTVLTVFNFSNRNIQVQEGILSWKTNLSPGERTQQRMTLTDTINFLSIKYLKDGTYQPIPNCPSGTFYYSISVNVREGNDPNQPPVCY
jgi:hypothetical protein